MRASREAGRSQGHRGPLEAIAIYENLRAILSVRMNVMPTLETQALYASLKAPEIPATRS